MLPLFKERKNETPDLEAENYDHDDPRWLEAHRSQILGMMKQAEKKGAWPEDEYHLHFTDADVAAKLKVIQDQDKYIKANLNERSRLGNFLLALKNLLLIPSRVINGRWVNKIPVPKRPQAQLRKEAELAMMIESNRNRLKRESQN